MDNIKIILASESPRRAELLRQQGINFSTIPSRCDESIDFSIGTAKAVKELSFRKARDVFNQNTDSLVIGSDTAVDLDGTVLCKPKTAEEAEKMLTALSGRTHFVYTGVTILFGKIVKSFVTKTSVKFFKLTDSEIAEYIKSGEPFDKAGGYGIQGRGAFLVEKINGDYYSVMGLPVARVTREIKNIQKKIK